MNSSSGAAHFVAIADGRTLIRSKLNAYSVNVMSLPVSGVQSLTLEATTNDGSATCDAVSLYVSHLLCYSGDCAKTGQNPRYIVRAPSNSLADMPFSSSNVDWLDTDRDRLNFMVGRSVGSEAPYLPIRITSDEKLFLHPTVAKRAWMDFDVTGLEQVALVGDIQPLSEACAANRGAGIVDMIVSLDGTEVARSVVDRDNATSFEVPIGAATRMRVSVDVGNGADWCDWFSFGFREVRKH